MIKTFVAKVRCTQLMYMTKSYIDKGLVLAIVSNKNVFKVTIVKWKHDILILNTITKINLMFCNCNVHVYLLSCFYLYKTDVGVTYIRWGKKTCPEAADLIYSGIALIM